jgi:phytanoyl-CoA hydroxylase
MSGIPIQSINGHLAVNDGPLNSDSVSLLRPSYPSEPIEELRKRYDEDGMLLVRGLLPREDIIRARTYYFSMMAPTGVLKDGTEPSQGIFNDKRSPEDFPGIGSGVAGMNGRPGGASAAEFVDLAIEAHYKSEYTENLCKHPVLLDFVARFTGWNENTLGLKRSLLRNNVPGTTPIGVHYDQIFLRYGEPTSLTAWVPIGDVSLTGGGLIYLEDGL